MMKSEEYMKSLLAGILNNVETIEENKKEELRKVVGKVPFEVWVNIFNKLDSNGLHNLPNILETSNYFNKIVSETLVLKALLEQYRLDRVLLKRQNLNDLQKAYLSSKRVQEQIQKGKLTAKQAFENAKSFEKLNLKLALMQRTDPNYYDNLNNPLFTVLQLLLSA